MNIDVKSFAHLRLALGKSPLTMEVPDSTTVGDLITLIADRYGDPAREALWTRDGKTMKITPVSNGKVLDPQMPLAEGMTVVFMANVAGGSR